MAKPVEEVEGKEKVSARADNSRGHSNHARLIF